MLEDDVLVLDEDWVEVVEEVFEEAEILLEDLEYDLEEVLEEAGILREDLDDDFEPAEDLVEALIVKELSVGLPEDGFSELGFPKKELEDLTEELG